MLCAVAMLMAACGGGEMSLTEYVERIDAIFARGIQRYEVLVASPEGLVLIVGQGPHFGFDDQGASLSDFTPEDLHVALEQLAEIQAEALEAAATIDPPEEIAELHALYFRELPIAALAARAGTAAGLPAAAGTGASGTGRTTEEMAAAGSMMNNRCNEVMIGEAEAG